MNSVSVSHGGRARVLSFIGASVIALASSPVLAQTEAPAAAPAAIDDAYNMGEIIVTAQRREQNLQEVPIAISAVGEKFLERRNITSLEQMGSIAPNVKIERGSSSSTVTQVVIRGATTLNPSMSWEPAVGMYMDGVYLGKAQGGFFDVADIERVEVLRGPQGTLYGRNTLAGAVNIITKKPSGELGGKAQVSVGNYDYHQARATIDLPSFGDFAVKLSGQITKRDGFYDVVPNPVPAAVAASNADISDLDSVNSKSGLIQVQYNPGNGFVADYAFDYSKVNQRPQWNQPYSVDAGNIFDPTSPAYNLGGLYFPYEKYVSKDYRKDASVNTNTFERVRVYGHNLTLRYDAGDIGELKSITAYRDVAFDDLLDLDGSPLPLAQSGRDSDYRFFSQELQLAGSQGSFDYVVGLFFSSDKASTLNPQTFFGGGAQYDSRFSGKTKSYAAFTQVDYHATDALTFTAGLRYTHEKKTISRYYVDLINPANNFAFNIGQAPGRVDEAAFTAGQLYTGGAATYNNVSPTFVVNYKFNEEVNGYAKYAKGFKSGGFNGETLWVEELVNPYKPEKLDSYEIGLKTRMFDNRLSLNVAAFWNETKDMQLSVFTAQGGTASYVLNAGKARVRGLEVEANAQLFDGLNFVGSFSYLDAKYKEYMEGGVNEADNRGFIYAPKYQVNASLDWRAAEFSNGSQLNLIGDLNYVAKAFNYPYALRGFNVTGQNAYETRIPARTVVDFRAVLSNIPGGNADWTLSAYVKNAFDVNKPRSFMDFGSNFGGLTVANYIEPRTYGITLGVNF